MPFFALYKLAWAVYCTEKPYAPEGTMNDLARIPCVLMRGGTSKGPYFLASDLPADPADRDQVLLAVMGSGHWLEIDGIGGGNPLTSKVAIVSPSKQPGADVDYLFAQVKVEDRVVDTSPNCGNMLAGIGPFAIEAGLVPAQAGITTVRIYNVNTRRLIEARISTPDKTVTYDGDVAITTGMAASTQETSTPSTLSTADPVGSNFPVFDPAAPKNARWTGAAVPGTPSIATSPS